VRKTGKKSLAMKKSVQKEQAQQNQLAQAPRELIKNSHPLQNQQHLGLAQSPSQLQKQSHVPKQRLKRAPRTAKKPLANLQLALHRP
jgi:uncharacterized protein involved in propanediol utilization